MERSKRTSFSLGGVLQAPYCSINFGKDVHGWTVERSHLFTSPACPRSGQGAGVFVTVLKYRVLIENLSYGKETVLMTPAEKTVRYSQFLGEEGHARAGRSPGFRAGGTGRGGN